MHAPHIFGCGIDAVQQQQGTKERADVETKQSWSKRKLKNYRPRHAVSDLRLRAPVPRHSSIFRMFGESHGLGQRWGGGEACTGMRRFGGVEYVA